jgi:hypothetical protein
MDRLTIRQAEEIAEKGFLAVHLYNKNVIGLTAHVAGQLADTMRENERLKEDLADELIHRRTCADKVRIVLKSLEAEIPYKHPVAEEGVE